MRDRIVVPMSPEDQLAVSDALDDFAALVKAARQTLGESASEWEVVALANKIRRGKEVRVVHEDDGVFASSHVDRPGFRRVVSSEGVRWVRERGED